MKKEICIVQLTRIGDLIQTYQAITALKEQYPESIITLIARKQYATPILFMLEQNIDHIRLLDFKKYKNTSNSIPELNSKLETFVKSINQIEYDVVINLSFSKSSAYLCSLINSKHFTGMRYDKDAQVLIPDDWSQFLSATVQQGRCNPFNLVDLYKLIIGVKLKPQTTESTNRPLKLKDNNIVIIHPFASQSRKRWNNKKWVEVLLSLNKVPTISQIVLVGGNNDIDDANQILSGLAILKDQNKLISKVGNSSIGELSLLLKSASLLIAHDSMVSHLAASVKTQSLIISLGNARYFETAPYTQGNIVLSPRVKCYPCFPDEKCEIFQCHFEIGHSIIAKLTQMALAGTNITYPEIKKNISDFHLHSCNIFKTVISDNGQLHCDRIDNHYPSAIEIMRTIYNITFFFINNNIDLNTKIPKISQETYSLLLNEMNSIGHLYELAEFGKRYSKDIILEIQKTSPDLEIIKDKGNKIDEIDKLQELIKTTSKYLSPAIDLFKLKKAFLVGDNIVEIAQSSYMAYDANINIMTIMYQMIELILSEHKIKSPKESTL